MTSKVFCSIIIPVLNEKNRLSEQLAALQTLRHAGHEIILVDGGSQDGSVDTAAPYVDQLISSKAGRATQMNKGAACAKHEWLLFLHIDTRLSDTAMAALEAIAEKKIPQWGRFDVRLSGQHVLFRMIAWFMNHRSRLTGIATGDQGIFVAKDYFEQVGGFPDIPIMEDIAISKALKKLSPPVCLTDKVITSSRRWQQNGILKTILFMWSLRLRYFLGVNPIVLARQYHQVKK